MKTFRQPADRARADHGDPDHRVGSRAAATTTRRATVRREEVLHGDDRDESRATSPSTLDQKTPKATGDVREVRRGEASTTASASTAIAQRLRDPGRLEGLRPAANLGPTVVGEVPTDHYPVGSLAAAKGSNDPAGHLRRAVLHRDGLERRDAAERLRPVRHGRPPGSTSPRRSRRLPIQGGANDGKPASKITIKKITVNVVEQGADDHDHRAGHDHRAAERRRPRGRRSVTAGRCPRRPPRTAWNRRRRRR